MTAPRIVRAAAWWRVRSPSADVFIESLMADQVPTSGRGRISGPVPRTVLGRLATGGVADMTTLTVDDGSSVQLGAVLAKAGEGSIHQVIGRVGLVAKLFHPTLADRAEKLDKVAAMVN